MSWLSSDEVQFLFAILLQNQLSNKCFHVLKPTITQTVADLYAVFPQNHCGKATEKEKQQYQNAIGNIQKYVDSWLDILKHKFLVYVCNVGRSHWISIVVINPFLVFDQYNVPSKGKDAVVLDDEDFAGWCILDSLHRGPPNLLDFQGLHGTMGNRYKAKYGVRLFLNICASYLKARAMRNEGLLTEEDCFPYEEPFGPYTEYRGTVGFPRLDIVAPSILSQSNSWDCGIAVVANSMAFIKCFKKAKFVKGNMKLSFHSKLLDAELIGVIYLFKDREYCSQQKFWNKVISESGTQYRDDDEIITSQNVLTAMRQEFIEIVDEIAADSVTDADQKLFDEVVSHLKSLDTDTHCNQQKLSFFEHKIIEYQADEMKSALKEKIAQGEIMTDIVYVDNDSDDGTTKPSFKEEVTIATDVVDTELSGTDVAQAIPAASVVDTEESDAQVLKDFIFAMAKLKEDKMQHDTVNDLQKMEEMPTDSSSDTTNSITKQKNHGDKPSAIVAVKAHTSAKKRKTSDGKQKSIDNHQKQ
jgi:hypothetical protein